MSVCVPVWNLCVLYVQVCTICCTCGETWSSYISISTYKWYVICRYGLCIQSESYKRLSKTKILDVQNSFLLQYGIPTTYWVAAGTSNHQNQSESVPLMTLISYTWFTIWSGTHFETAPTLVCHKSYIYTLFCTRESLRESTRFELFSLHYKYQYHQEYW